MSELKRKGILLLLSSVMLVSAGVYLAVAWYTKVTSVSGMVFEAAQWEFTANYEVDDIEVNVYTYSTSKEDKAAPGTAGTIPIRLGADQSDTDVDYQIWIDKSTMSAEFQERIYFYKSEEDLNSKIAFDENSSVPITGTIPKGSSTTVNIYWEWVYEYKDVPGVNPAEKDFEQTSMEFDEFDTLVGKNPDLYEDMMSATLRIVGTQSSPQKTS